MEKKTYVCPEFSIVGCCDDIEIVTTSGTDVLAKKLDDWLNG